MTYQSFINYYILFASCFICSPHLLLQVDSNLPAYRAILRFLFCPAPALPFCEIICLLLCETSEGSSLANVVSSLTSLCVQPHQDAARDLISYSLSRAQWTAIQQPSSNIQRSRYSLGYCCFCYQVFRAVEHFTCRLTALLSYS